MKTQTLLITGATSGIGRHAALYLAGRGHRVIATGRRLGALDALAAEADGLPLDTLVLDVTDPESIAMAVEEVDRLTDGRGIDVLINNAGYGQGGAVLDVGLGAVRDQYETNVFGLLAVTRAFAPQMMRRGSGRILNVSSIGGRVTLPLMGVYTSTKYAVESLSDALRAELAPFGVDVVVVEPGAIRTGFNGTVQSTVDAVDHREDGPWGPAYASSSEMLARFDRLSPDPTPVSRAFARAIESRRPRARYVAPRQGVIMLALVGLLPARLVDAVLRRFLGIDRARLPTRTAVAA